MYASCSCFTCEGARRTRGRARGIDLSAVPRRGTRAQRRSAVRKVDWPPPRSHLPERVEGGFKAVELRLPRPEVELELRVLPPPVLLSSLHLRGAGGRQTAQGNAGRSAVLWKVEAPLPQRDAEGVTPVTEYRAPGS